MKITCSECATSFDIPLAMMPPGGRRMRCAKCGHIWHQMPPEAERFDFAIDVDPIPASVHPAARDEPGDEPAGPGLMATLPWPMITRLAAGFALGWAVILALVYALAVAGFAPRLLAPLAPGGHAGGGTLEFHDLSAATRPDGVTLTGRIFNPTDKAQPIPMVEITPVMPDGDKAEPRQVRPEQDSLQPQEGVPFTAQLPGIPAEAQLRLRFMPSELKAEKTE